METMVLNTEDVFLEPRMQNMEQNRGKAEAKRNFICATLRMRYV